MRQRAPEVAYTLVTVAAIRRKTRNLATIYVRLKPIEERKRDQFVVMGIVRDEVLPALAPRPADVRPAGRDASAAAARRPRTSSSSSTAPI